MILNKNVCYEIWYQYLRFLSGEKKVIFSESFEGSYYKKGEYIHYKIKGIFIPDNNISNRPKFITDEDKVMSIDKVGILEHITKTFFPSIECDTVQKLQSTIVYGERERIFGTNFALGNIWIASAVFGDVYSCLSREFFQSFFKTYSFNFHYKCKNISCYMIQNYADIEIEDDDYTGGYGEEEITREIIREKQRRIKIAEG